VISCEETCDSTTRSAVTLTGLLVVPLNTDGVAIRWVDETVECVEISVGEGRFVGVGDGRVGDGGGAAGGADAVSEPSVFQSPVMTPTLMSAKNAKRAGVKSRPPNGQPGQVSTIVACALFP